MITAMDNSSQKAAATTPCCSVNIGEPERMASMVGGGLLALYGLSRRSLGGLALAALGGLLVVRGKTGYCGVYDALGVTSPDIQHNPEASVRYNFGTRAEASITIRRSPEALYSFWRDVESLPRFMKNLTSVTRLDDTHSHWVARGPAGQTVEWDAEILNETPNRMIAWRSLEGSQVHNAGSVHFLPLEEGRGTSVHVALTYEPLAGKIGAALGKALGGDVQKMLEKDLRRLKTLMESGEAETVSA